MDYIYTSYDMESEHDKYWHIQMNKSDGKNSDPHITRQLLLEEQAPVIATREWKVGYKDPTIEMFKSIPKGSVVLVREGKQAIALCRIVGPTRKDETLKSKYRYELYRDVEIIGFATQNDQPREELFNLFGALFSCGIDTEQGLYIDRLYTSMKLKRRYTELLKSKKNIILQGAPGTGKTYTTAALAVGICNESFADFDEHTKLMEEYERLRASRRISFCTFHQSLDYEDFVEGLKPKLKNGHISYRIEPGIFKSICREAALAYKKAASEKRRTPSYVLIIDEINRGNISKIFGELITLLEADKRSGGGEHNLHVKLPYSKEDFSVPSNLYIIGTMNTTDRSTGSIDYAVRRRFAFVPLEPRAAALREYYAQPSRAIPTEVEDAALALFDEINGTTEGSESFIAKHKAMDFDLEDLKVGHSYFMAESLEALQLKMRYEVIPLLREYIKDGILRQLPEDEQYFACWREAKPFTPQPTDSQQG